MATIPLFLLWGAANAPHGAAGIHRAHRPGASPLLFADFLMSLAAFVSLEDISAELPAYTEEVIGVGMDAPLEAAYEGLEESPMPSIFWM